MGSCNSTGEKSSDVVGNRPTHTSKRRSVFDIKELEELTTGSDCADVKIDPGTDTFSIPETLSTYPHPSTPDQVGGRTKHKDIWYADDEFNNAIGELNVLSDDVTDDGKTANDIRELNNDDSDLPNYLSFFEVDNHVRKASKNELTSFDNLFEYINQITKGKAYKKTFTARAIAIWLSSQNIGETNFGKPSTESPGGLLQLLKDNDITYAGCYAILCRRAKLKCVKISGYVKAAGYEVGNDTISETTWNAVNVESGWQLVHPFWICKPLYGESLRGWVKVNTPDESRSPKGNNQSGGIVKSTFHERYFMPDPEEFIFECCAIEPKWQLVKPSSIVTSREQFIRMPYLRPPFFGLGLRLVSDQTCVINAVNGVCRVVLKCTSANSHLLSLRYELKLLDNDEDSSASLHDGEIPRMVLNSRAGNLFTFEIRFPKVGDYKLVIYGGPFKAPTLRLYEVKIVCKREVIDKDLLPIGCKDVGWGPGPQSVEAKLFMPNRPSGIIFVDRKSKTVDIKFHVLRNRQQHSVCMKGVTDGEIQQFDDCLDVNTENKQLVIKAILPRDGEFAVMINRVLSGSNNIGNVCNYLLTSSEGRESRSTQRYAKRKLEDALSEDVTPEYWKKKISRVEKLTDKCKREHIHSSDEFMLAASEELDFIRCKDRLRDCRLRRNASFIRGTLAVVDNYKNKPLICMEIDTVRELLHEVELEDDIRLDEEKRDPEITRASRAILKIYYPKAEMFDVIKALFLLIGEPIKEKMEWRLIQSRFRESGLRGDNVPDKITRFRKRDINHDRRRKAKQFIENYDDTTIRNLNEGIYTLYGWVKTMLQK